MSVGGFEVFVRGKGGRDESTHATRKRRYLLNCSRLPFLKEADAPIRAAQVARTPTIGQQNRTKCRTRWSDAMVDS